MEEGEEEEEVAVKNPFAMFGSGDLLGSGDDDAVLGEDDGGELGSGNFTLGGDDDEGGEEEEEEEVSVML